MLTAHQYASRIQVLKAELLRRASSNSLESFLQAAWPLIEPKLPFIQGFHIGAICEHLEAVFAGEIRNLLINIPPRHAKSTIVSVGFPAWVWSRQSSTKFLYASHSYSLSKRDSVKTRNVVQSNWYRDTFGINWSIADDQNEKSNFLNTDGGFRRATSVLSTIIGEGGDILVLDDPHSPRSVSSDAQRQSELDWIGEEFFTRINDPKTVSKIVIMQRLDQRDASAHLLEEGDWEHLMMPAEYESTRKCSTVMGWEDPREKDGEPLWPERFDEEGLKVLKKMGSKAWAGQGQQRPAPAEGNIIKREWFKYYDVLPSDLDFFCLSVDLSFDEGAKASYAVFQTWGRKKAQKYLIAQVRRQIGFTEQLSVFKTLSNAVIQGTDNKRPMAKWIEKKANGAALISTVQKEITGVIAVEPRGSKEVRLESVSPQFEAGNVFIPNPELLENASWVPDYIEELITFPGALHDDQVDATSQALSKMSDQVPTDCTPVMLTGRSKWLGR